MATYVMIDGTTYQTDSAEQIREAARALGEAGYASAPVYTSPRSIEEIEAEGDPDGYRNGQVIYAERAS